MVPEILDTTASFAASKLATQTFAVAFTWDIVMDPSEDAPTLATAPRKSGLSLLELASLFRSEVMTTSVPLVFNVQSRIKVFCCTLFTATATFATTLIVLIVTSGNLGALAVMIFAFARDVPTAEMLTLPCAVIWPFPRMPVFARVVV